MRLMAMQRFKKADKLPKNTVKKTEDEHMMWSLNTGKTVNICERESGYVNGGSGRAGISDE